MSTDGWARLGLADLPAEVRAAIGLPDPPAGDLAEFGPRYAAAERAAWRYHRAMSADPLPADPLPTHPLPTHPLPAHPLDGPRRQQLLDGWPRVRAELAYAGRLCEHGVRVPAVPVRVSPARRLRGRKRLSPRLRHLHNLHRSLVALERAADSAVAVVVAAELARSGPEQDVDVALRALTAALDELTPATREALT